MEGLRRLHEYWVSCIGQGQWTGFNPYSTWQSPSYWELGPRLVEASWQLRKVLQKAHRDRHVSKTNPDFAGVEERRLVSNLRAAYQGDQGAAHCYALLEKEAELLRGEIDIYLGQRDAHLVPDIASAL